MSLTDIVQKAFYLGVGLAATAGELAGDNFGQLREKAQKLADELVAKGEMTAEEAKKVVDEMVRNAQNQSPKPDQNVNKQPTGEPRLIEIADDDEKPDTEAEAMRRQVENLRAELEKLRKEQK
jgi:polyhydroxyalkanoate synthesis regulator phasin